MDKVYEVIWLFFYNVKTRKPMLRVLFRVLLRFKRNPYPLANILGGVLCAVLSGIAITLISGLETMWLFLGFFALLFVLYNEIVRRSFFSQAFFSHRFGYERRC